MSSRRLWIRVALLVGMVTAIGAGLWIWRESPRALVSIRERVAELGLWGPLATIGLNVAQVLLAPIPGQFVGLINGYLYGIWLGTLYSMLGLLIGTALAMGLARRFGRPLVERLVNPEQLARWDRIAQGQGPPFFFLVFLLPSLPDDLTCFLIGLSPLELLPMLVLAMLGRLPGVFVSCWAGASAGTLPWWSWIPLGGAAAGAAWAFWRYRERTEELMLGLIHRLTGRR